MVESSKTRHIHIRLKSLILFIIIVCFAVLFQFRDFLRDHAYDDIGTVMVTGITTTVNDNNSSLSPSPAPPPERRAIFMISMGEAAASGKIVERSLLSIRRRGDWNGYVVLLPEATPGRYLPLQELQ
jgi:hypothetical protein